MPQHLMVTVENNVLSSSPIDSPPNWQKQKTKLFYAETHSERNGERIYWSYDLTNLVSVVGTTSEIVDKIGSLG